MTQPPFFTLSVTGTKQLTPNVQRITLSGEALNALSPGCESDYFKLVFNQDGGTELRPDEKPRLRTYTIRHFYPESNSIDIDMVRHSSDCEGHGLAGRWAMTAKVGDKIAARAPAQLKPFPLNAPWYVFIADLTALPAMVTSIAKLPANAKGYVVVQVIDKEDIQPLNLPEGLTLIWLTSGDDLIEKVRTLAWRDNLPFVWCACEFDHMRSLRRYFTNERHIERSHMYMSSYWKKGVTEEGHKAIKREDAENLQALT